MGAAPVAVGALLGAGLFCLWWSCWPRPRAHHARDSPRRRPVRAALDAAGWADVPAALLPSACLLAALLAALAVAGSTGVLVLALAAGAAAGCAPVAALRARTRQRSGERAAAWPDVVDTVASAVRAGAPLPDAVCALAVRGPVHLRPAFARFAVGHRSSGAFEPQLAQLQAELADPVFDRLAATLRMTRQVGGSDLGGTLRTLSAYLREDQRARGELLARQSWTVSAARLAVAAPWLVLALLGTRPGALAVYDTPRGAAVLVTGALVCALSYRLMVRLGRLPAARRVLA
ncbi:type II secretion system F family protein [Kineococcus sp. SYSU DK006]|uniref:type II secretion system F family protein n=1 Tax=Kineococcus sp. SYSU DK006 TaxID=3383127 RepID=UPI003D7D7764